MPIIKKDKFSRQREAPPRERASSFSSLEFLNGGCRHVDPTSIYSTNPKQGTSQQQTHPLILQQRTRGYKKKTAFSDTNYIF
jgi:hypothetical protein